MFEQQAKGNTDEGSPAIIPGNAKKSRLIQRLHETDPELRMPYEKPALSKEEIALFTEWINQGAEWGTHWAYIPPEKSEIPRVSQSFDKKEFIQTPIDYFIAANMEYQKLNHLYYLFVSIHHLQSIQDLKSFYLETHQVKLILVRLVQRYQMIFQD